MDGRMARLLSPSPCHFYDAIILKTTFPTVGIYFTKLPEKLRKKFLISLHTNTWQHRTDMLPTYLASVCLEEEEKHFYLFSRVASLISIRNKEKNCPLFPFNAGSYRVTYETQGATIDVIWLRYKC